MLINSDDIKTTKEQIEVMQAFIDGIEIEYKEKFENNEYKKIYYPTWDFANYQYRIAQSEPIKKTHNVPFFHSIMADQFVELGIELPDYMVKQLSQAKLDYLTKKAERLRKETGYPKFDESIMEYTENKLKNQR